MNRLIFYRDQLQARAKAGILYMACMGECILKHDPMGSGIA